MALKKLKELKDGTSGEYWAITHFNLNKKDKKIEYTVELYVNKLKKDEGKAPMPLSKSKKFALSDLEILGNLMEIGYQKIKADAAIMITHDIMGNLLASPIPKDPDLYQSEDV